MKVRILLCTGFVLCTWVMIWMFSPHRPSVASAETLQSIEPPSSSILEFASTSIQIQNSDSAAFGCTDDPENYLIDTLHAIEVGEDESPAQAYDDFNRNFAQQWLNAGCFRGWVHDKTIRDTGPFVQEQMYMVHPSVVIYYSPSVVKWLDAGRPKDAIPDNAIIIKEQYRWPAARYSAFIAPGDVPTPDTVDPSDFYGWSVMFRNAKASKDGWFWGGYGTNAGPAIDAFPFNQYPYGGYGQINGCLRCHAVAEDETYTFSSQKNIDGEGLRYMVDQSWMTPTPDPDATPVAPPTPTPMPTPVVRQTNPEFVAFFNQLEPVSAEDVKVFPNVIHDTVFAGPDGSPQFQTSNQCATCHGGLAGPPYGPQMYIPPTEAHAALEGFAHEPGRPHSGISDNFAGAGINISPKGEWNWSMMGLAGRDPVFYAQLESELNLHPSDDLPDLVQDTCLRCHGVMGQRQFHIDHPTDDNIKAEDEPRFLKEEAFSHTKYGALARDGISCTVCHQIEPGDLQETDTGRFTVAPPDNGVVTIIGPFEDPTQHPMQTSMGLVPEHSDFISTSELCSSCHTIRLPVWDAEDRLIVTTDEQETQVAYQLFEQTTYLEWLNSSYAQSDGPEWQSCQDCHMPNNLNGNPLTSKIAVIQDQDYPEFENEVPLEDMTVNPRDGYSRHSLHGLNLFALEMFNQFADILGVAKSDYMTGSKTDLAFAVDDYVDMAVKQTAVVSVTNTTVNDDGISAEVSVTNLTGHRFPSGVGFRRAFLQVRVIDDNNNVVWTSGGTNSIGVIVDADGQPLPTEMLPDSNTYQPHHQVITQTSQVQIYEELTLDPQENFTTSFISRCQLAKDNRLMAKGWSDTAPDNFPNYSPSDTSFKIGDAPTVDNSTIDGTKKLVCETESSFEAVVPHLDWEDPEGRTAGEIDPDYTAGSATDTTLYRIATADLPSTPNETWRIDATLYYQATPPYYLRDRFVAGRHADKTYEPAQIAESERLYFLASNLNVNQTPIDGWKLEIATHTQVPSTADASAGAAPLWDRVSDTLTSTPIWVTLAAGGAVALVAVTRRRRIV